MTRLARLVAAASLGLALASTATLAHAETTAVFEAEDVQLLDTGCVFQHVRTVVTFDDVVTWSAQITVTDPDGRKVHSLTLVEETGTGRDATYEMIYCAASKPGTYTITGEATSTLATPGRSTGRAARASAVDQWTDTFQVRGSVTAPTSTPPPSPAVVPSRVGAPRLTARAHAIVVRWQAPPSASPITGYLVDVSKQRTRTLSTTDRTVKLRHLTTGRYRIRVAARNAAGLSAYSRWVSVRVP